MIKCTLKLNTNLHTQLTLARNLNVTVHFKHSHPRVDTRNLSGHPSVFANCLSWIKICPISSSHIISQFSWQAISANVVNIIVKIQACIIYDYCCAVVWDRRVEYATHCMVANVNGNAFPGGVFSCWYVGGGADCSAVTALTSKYVSEWVPCWNVFRFGAV